MSGIIPSIMYYVPPSVEILRPTTPRFQTRISVHQISNHFDATVSISFPSFIHSRIYKAPLQEIGSEAPPAQPRRYRSVLSSLQNALSLFLGRIRISKGSPFQVEGPTMENA